MPEWRPRRGLALLPHRGGGDESGVRGNLSNLDTSKNLLFDGNDVINGDAGDDYAEGGLGNDSISGGVDNDTLLGQAGADTIGGGTGFDYLYGGTEADVFVCKGDSYDTVWDFNAAEGDKVRIDPALAGSFTEFQSRLSGFTSEGADFTVFLSADGLDQLIMKGIAHTARTGDLLTLTSAGKTGCVQCRLLILAGAARDERVANLVVLAISQEARHEAPR